MEIYRRKRLKKNYIPEFHMYGDNRLDDRKKNINES